MPGFPGAAWSSESSGDWTSFQASACSRPPDPTRRTRTGRVYSVAEITLVVVSPAPSDDRQAGSLVTSIGGYATLAVPSDRWGWIQSEGSGDRRAA